jgi:GGDEF domain-containing protein
VVFEVDPSAELAEHDGSPLGDALRVAFARRLQQQLAGVAGAAIARFGRSTFAALLPGTALPEAQRLAENLLQSLRQQPLLPGRPALTACAGVGRLQPADAPAALLAPLLAALDQARMQGGGRLVLAAQELPPDYSVASRA